MVRAVAEVLAAGDVLGGRYRLDRLVGAEHAPVGTGLWRAEDLTLSRPVAVRTVVGAGVAVRTALFDAAARASAVHDPLLAATYDADTQAAPGGGTVAYLVREWVDGQPLGRQLTDGGLEPRRLVPLLTAASEAVAALHAGGGWHGRVHPDNLLVEPDGRIRLTDPGTSAALAAAGVLERDAAGRATAPPPLPAALVADLSLGPASTDPAAPRADPTLLRRAQRYDTCDLARVAYAAATGLWVGGAWRELGAAPTDGERPRTPRQVRAAVPRQVDAVVVRTLLPPPGRQAALQDAAAVAAAFGRIDLVERETGAAAAPRRRLRRPNRWAVRAGLLALIVVLGAVGYGLGKRIGSVPGTPDPAASFSASPTATASGAAPAGASLTLHTVSAFDPPPGDGQENDDQVPLADDGSTATAWTTERYSSATFGGLKTGVGLLVDLGSVTQVASVQLALAGAPTTVQLRASDAGGGALADYPVVVTGRATGETLTLKAGAAHRYWLVWLTSLPKVSGGYRGGVSELLFRS